MYMLTNASFIRSKRFVSHIFFKVILFFQIMIPQVMFELGEPYNQMEMASFMSCSKVIHNISPKMIIW